MKERKKKNGQMGKERMQKHRNEGTQEETGLLFVI
jgi:hypothetical protein